MRLWERSGEGKQRGTWRDTGLSTKLRFRPGLHLLAAQLGAVTASLSLSLLIFKMQIMISTSQRRQWTWEQFIKCYSSLTDILCSPLRLCLQPHMVRLSLPFTCPSFCLCCLPHSVFPSPPPTSSDHILLQAEPRCCVVCEAL